MSTIRTDPVTGRRVIIAADRAERPRDLRESVRDRADEEECPFCRGHESATPSAIDVYPEGSGSDWQVRVVPNKYPAVTPGRTPPAPSDGELFEEHDAVGRHEVIVETSDHVTGLHDLSDRQVERVVRAWRNRLVDLADDDALEYALLFKNQGAPAGASLEHVHSQLMALPTVPGLVAEELDGAADHHAEHGECVFCRMIDASFDSGERLVFADESMVVMAPYAPRFPFELMILPRDHSARFSSGAAADDRQVAAALRKTLERLDRALDAPPFNLVVHTAPLRSKELPHYHWHIEVIPTLSHIAGFEWGSGYHINPTPPEKSARRLRHVDQHIDDAAG
jgi:UDPglucose--hexose-1-phosphate uridylyltransferase